MELPLVGWYSFSFGFLTGIAITLCLVALNRVNMKDMFQPEP